MIRFYHAALLLSVLSQAYSQSSKGYSTVLRVEGWTTTGVRIDKIWVVVSARNGKDKYTASGRDVQLSIPTGDHVLEVRAPGFETKRQSLKAYQPAVFRSAVLPIARLHGHKSSRLIGIVQNYDGDIKRLRVRLMALYGDELREAIPDTRGAFGFPADEGTYLLVTVADLEKGIAIVDSRPVQIPLEEQQTVTIDLKGKRGIPIPPLAR